MSSLQINVGIVYVINIFFLRCLSLPIVMRSLMKKSKSYRPEIGAAITTAAKNSNYQQRFQKPLKLVMPSLAQMQANHPLMSPQLTSSPSSFLNFTAGGISPGTAIFPPSNNSDSGIAKHGKKRNTPGTPGTPGSDGSRTPNKLKLPKITLKRKRTEASDIYEIDKTKSDIETGEAGVVSSTAGDVSDNLDSLSFVYSQFESDIPMKSSQGMFADTEPFPGLGSLEGESDIDKLLGIPSEPFVQESGPLGELHN